jgi:ADP-heptose:LPS heptosyltransferase
MAPFKLGDFIQSTPFLSELRKDYLKEEIVLIALRGEVAEAAQLTNLVDRAILLTEEEFREGRSKNLEGSPDLLVNLSSAPAALNFGPKLRPRQILGPRQDGEKIILPLAQKLVQAVMQVNRRLGRLNLVDMWRLLSPKGAQASRELVWPKNIGRDLSSSEAKRAAPKIGFQLGCGHKLRRWPIEHFRQLASQLSPIEIILLGGRAEKSLAKHFLDLKGPKIDQTLNLCGQTSLSDLGAVLGSLDLLVAVDTGVTHLAAALGTPIAALFGGPAYAFETGPYSLKALSVQGKCDCSPCVETNPCPKRLCPALPPVDIAAQAANIILNRSLTFINEPNSPPASFSIYRTEPSALGLRLLSITNTALDDETKLALAIEEAQAAILNPKTQGELNQNLLSHYRPSKGGLSTLELTKTILKVADGLADQLPLREAFFSAARESLTKIELWEKNQ